MTSHWRAEGARYERPWGGRPWALQVDAERAGLVADEGRLGPLLALDGITARGRSDPGALGGASLAGHEARFDRVEATYAPAGWGSLRVRATWSPRDEQVVDLEVQVQAFTVGDLEEVEVHILSRLDSATLEELAAPPAAVDVGSTLPIRPDGPIPPLLAQVAHVDDGRAYYLEMIHPDDGLRREVDRTSGAVRYALFGYDLERGVIVRGRLRGIWYATRPDAAEVSRRLGEFLREPPPLGT